jgi:peptidoglycan/LPS O-acetylase OafA/YrhL
MKYRPDIDGLRAVAVVPVILFHFGLPHLGGGYVGVDIFFVISGFLITSLIAPEIQTAQFSIFKFYERRIRRIFPALFVVTACTIPFAVTLLLPTALRHYGESLVAMTLFASNFVFWHEAGYFDASSYSKPLLHTWSLAVEEQFYIFFPLLLLLLWRLTGKRQGRTVAVLAGLGVLSFFMSLWLTNADPAAAFYGPHARAWELLTGCLLALIARPDLGPWISNLFCTIGLGLIFYTVFSFTSATSFPGWNAVFPVLGAALIVRFGDHSNFLAGPLLRSKPMIFVGKISYSAYLWHWPIIVFSTYYLERNLTPWEMAAASAATFLLSVISWHWIEQPARRVRIARRKIFAAAAAAIVLMFPLGLAAHTTRGFPGRYKINPEPLGVEAYGVDVCHMWRKPASAWNEAACTFPPSHGPAPRVFLWGDSFAAHYFPGLRSLQRSLPFTLIHASMSSCQPLPADAGRGPGTEQCQIFNRRIFALILREKPNLVIFSGRWDAGLSPYDLRLASSALSRLKAARIPVIVMGETPVFATPVPQTFVMNTLRGISDTQYKPENAFHTDTALRKISNDNGAVFFSARPLLCQDSRCKISDGQFLYWDEAHFSAHGSAVVIQDLAPVIRSMLSNSAGTNIVQSPGPSPGGSWR